MLALDSWQNYWCLDQMYHQQYVQGLRSMRCTALRIHKQCAAYELLAADFIHNRKCKCVEYPQVWTLTTMQSSPLDFMVYVIRTVRPRRIMIHDQYHAMPLPVSISHPVNHPRHIQMESPHFRTPTAQANSSPQSLTTASGTPTRFKKSVTNS